MAQGEGLSGLACLDPQVCFCSSGNGSAKQQKPEYLSTDLPRFAQTFVVRGRGWSAEEPFGHEDFRKTRSLLLPVLQVRLPVQKNLIIEFDGLSIRSLANVMQGPLPRCQPSLHRGAGPRHRPPGSGQRAEEADSGTTWVQPGRAGKCVQNVMKRPGSVQMLGKGIQGTCRSV